MWHSLPLHYTNKLKVVIVHLWLKPRKKFLKNVHQDINYTSHIPNNNFNAHVSQMEIKLLQVKCHFTMNLYLSIPTPTIIKVNNL